MSLNLQLDNLCPVINVPVIPVDMPNTLCVSCVPILIPETQLIITTTNIEVGLKSFIHGQVHTKFCTGS